MVGAVDSRGKGNVYGAGPVHSASGKLAEFENLTESDPYFRHDIEDSSSLELSPGGQPFRTVGGPSRDLSSTHSPCGDRLVATGCDRDRIRPGCQSGIAFCTDRSAPSEHGGRG